MGQVIAFPGHSQLILSEAQRELVRLLGGDPDECTKLLEPGKDATTGKSFNQLCAVVEWQNNLRLILPDGSMLNAGPNEQHPEFF